MKKLLKTFTLLLGLFPVSPGWGSTQPDAYAKFLKVVEGQDGRPAPRNIQELLPLLDPELRANFTLVYDSRSPHGNADAASDNAVDPLFPRVILFTPDARLLLAFTGNPSKPGYNTVESIHFDPNNAAFSTSSFVLPDALTKDPSRKGIPAKEVITKDRFNTSLNARNGELNRPECIRCHGADPRPIFDSYNVWPGFYGSLADQPGRHPKELANYQTFLSKQKNRIDLPYAKLDWGKKTKLPSTVYPYMDSKGDKLVAELESVEQLRLLPNTRLGMALTELNRARILRKLKQVPGYSKWRYAVILALTKCTSLPLPEEFRKEIYTLIERENASKIQRTGIDPKSEIAQSLAMQELREEFRDNLADVIYLTHAFKTGHSDWSMAFEANSFSFFDGLLSGIHNGRSFYMKEDLLFTLLSDLASDEPDFSKFFKSYNTLNQAGFAFGTRLDLSRIIGNNKLCTALGNRNAIAGIEEYPSADPSWIDTSPFAVRKATQMAPTQNPFDRCVHCHANSIPFNDLTALPTALLKTSLSSSRPLYLEVLNRIEPTSRKRMPMAGEPLSAQGREEIETWIREHVLAPGSPANRASAAADHSVGVASSEK